MPVLDITMSGPIFVSVVGLGLDDGMDMFILEGSGVDCGFGEGDGICMPGIVVSIFGDAPGDGDGMGMFISIVCCGEDRGLGEAAGVCIPGMFICTGGVGRAVGADVLVARSVLGTFLPGMFIPGMLRI
jgi:hypothetical protein